jgi:flagellar hook-basal body complex protein FliE
MSTKFAEILKQKPTNYRVKETILPSIFEIFINACQLKNFDVEKSNVFQLMDLAKEWGVISLQKYLDDYIKKNKLVRKDIADYLAILQENIEKKCDSSSDWSNVAHILQDIIDDERLLEIPPEVFLRILSIAETCGFEITKENRLKLIGFAMKLLDEHPENVAPLILRLDFSLIKPEQLRKIYACKQLHDHNIGYFLEMSLSALANKTEYAFAKNEILNKQFLQTALIEQKRKYNSLTEKLNKDFDKQVDDIIDEVDRQQDLLDDLHKAVDNTEKRMNDAEKKSNEMIEGIEEDRIVGIVENAEKTIDNLSKEVDERLNKYMNDLKEQSLDAENIAKRHFTLAAATGSNPYDTHNGTVEDLIKFGGEIREKEEDIMKEIKDIHRLIAAKVVRDKLRFDQFLRRTRGKFQAFEEEPQIWGLGSALVHDTEKTLLAMEKRLDELCPVRESQ